MRIKTTIVRHERVQEITLNASLNDLNFWSGENRILHPTGKGNTSYLFRIDADTGVISSWTEIRESIEKDAEG